MTGDSVEPVEPALEGRVLVPLEIGASHEEAIAEREAALEGRVLEPGEDEWQGFRLVYIARQWPGPPAGGVLPVWHDEASRLEERGRLDRAGCECDDCLGDKYSGEDFY